MGYDSTLLEAYSISVNSSYLGWVSVIVFDGVASDTQYEEVRCSECSAYNTVSARTANHSQVHVHTCKY